jgi:hypothetical protein
MQNEAQALIHRAALACWTKYSNTRAKRAGLFQDRSRLPLSYGVPPLLRVPDARLGDSTQNPFRRLLFGQVYIPADR